MVGLYLRYEAGGVRRCGKRLAAGVKKGLT
jgi:hypothetical protein